jgi:hypothetical protein
MGYSGPIAINSDEVEDGRFRSEAELNRRVGTRVFTPGFETEFTILKKSGVVGP